jgi:hypothetical protein
MQLIVMLVYFICARLVLAAPQHLSYKRHGESFVTKGRDQSLVSDASVSAATNGTSVAGNSTFVAAAWYAGWHAADFPIANVSWSKYSRMTYSFASVSSLISFHSIRDR